MKLIGQVRTQLEACMAAGDPASALLLGRREIDHRHRFIEHATATAQTERRDLLASEAREVEQMREQIRELEVITTRAESLTQAQAIEDREDRRQRSDNAVNADLSPNPREERGQVTGEPRVYDGRRGGPSFFRDIFQSAIGDPSATDRLARHARETEVELRAVTTANLAGLVPPQYLTGLWADLARAGRPFADAVRSLPLPDTGMKVNISKVTTGSTVAAQASEGTTVSNQDVDDTLLEVDVRTYAGYIEVSRQALERGEQSDEVLMSDLARAYATKVDSAIINEDGTAGTHKGVRSATGIVSVTYTDASPTLPELYKRLADASQQIQSNIFSGPSLIVMHPRRWGWCASELDTQNRPLVAPTGPMNAPGDMSAIGYGKIVGSLIGLPVITDANIPTNLGAGSNEDVILVVDAGELFLWETGDGFPVLFRADQPQANALKVWLVAFGYSAFTAERRPKAAAVISGTALVAPSFA